MFLQVSAFRWWRRQEFQQTVITHRSSSQRRAQVEVSVGRPLGRIHVRIYAIATDIYVEILLYIWKSIFV